MLGSTRYWQLGWMENLKEVNTYHCQMPQGPGYNKSYRFILDLC